MVCQFLLYNKVNQLYIYIHPHISSLLRLPPSHPPYPTPLGGHKAPSRSPCAMQLPPTSYLFYIWQCIYVHATLTSSQLTLPPPRVLKSILYVCVFIPVLPLGSSEHFFLRFHIYVFMLKDFMLCLLQPLWLILQIPSVNIPWCCLAGTPSPLWVHPPPPRGEARSIQR